MPTTPIRVALYARVSTHHDQDVGLQLDARREVAATRQESSPRELASPYHGGRLARRRAA